MENAEMYSSANGMQKKDAKEILAEFRDKLKWSNDSRVLDVGCGSGEVTTEILLPLLPKVSACSRKREKLFLNKFTEKSDKVLNKTRLKRGRERQGLRDPDRVNVGGWMDIVPYLPSPPGIFGFRFHSYFPEEQRRAFPREGFVGRNSEGITELQNFRELIGLDISLEMIQHARNLHSHPKVSFIHFDIAQNSHDLPKELKMAVLTSRNDNLNLTEIESRPETIEPLKNNKSNRGESVNRKSGYDVISSFYCLHWITNQRLVIKNIHELLKPGGEALLVFLAKSPIFTLYRKLSTMDLWKDYMQDVESFIPFYQNSENPLEKFTEILKSVKFKILSAACRERSYVFESSASLRNAIKAVNPFLSRIPNNLQEEFINECFRQTKLLNLTEFKDNCFKVNYKLIVAHVRKPL